MDFLNSENFQYETTTITTDKKLLLLKSVADIYAGKRICDSVCGRVFLPISSEENQQAVEILSTHGISQAWLRVSDIYEEGVWKDFETLEDMKFTNWGPGEPDDQANQIIDAHSEDYAVLLDNGYWNGIPSNIGAWILCELASLKEIKND